MPKKVNRLSAVKVAGTKKPGFYADGDGLYLQVTDSGSRSWVFRFKAGGRTRDMGLGSLNTVGTTMRMMLKFTLPVQLFATVRSRELWNQ